jgi:hypothetical protein
MEIESSGTILSCFQHCPPIPVFNGVTWASPGSKTWPGNLEGHHGFHQPGAGPGRTFLHQLSTCNALGKSWFQYTGRQPCKATMAFTRPTRALGVPRTSIFFFARPGNGRGNPGKARRARRPHLQSRLFFARPGYGRGNPGGPRDLHFFRLALTAEATLGRPTGGHTYKPVLTGIFRDAHRRFSIAILECVISI